MKKRLLSVALLMGGSIAAYSQVGIGTVKPNKSAELTIESSKRGVLIPRLGLTGFQDRTTIVNFPTNGINSLLVFNTATVEEKGKEKGLTPGFYYWFIDQWVRIPNEKDIPQIVINEYKTIFGDTDVVEQIQNIVNSTEGNVVYEGDTFYHITKEGDKVVKKEIEDKLTSIAYDEASGDYIYYNEKAVDRNGGIIGQGVRIKIKETVINKFGDIINNKNVQEYITNYLDGTYVGGNVYYDGNSFTYVTKEGETKNITIKDIVQGNESKTQIITVDEKQYYVSEEYLVDNNGVVPTNVDPKNLPAGIYAIDVVGGVVNNFEEIVNNGPIQVDGRTYPTVNDYITYLTESTGGFTKIVYDPSTGDVIFQEWNETTQKFENVDNAKFKSIVTDNESKTQIITVDEKQYYVSEEYLVDNKGVVPTSVDPKNLPAGIYAIDVVGGVVNNFEEIVNNGPIQVDGRTYPTINDYITYLTESKGGFTKIVYNKEGDVVFQEWNETTQKFENVDNAKFSTIVKDNETLTVLVDKGDGTLSYTDEKGKTVTFDSNKTNVEVLDGVYTFTNGKGEVIAIIDTKAKAISYDNSKSGITAENVQEALDQLADSLLKGAGVTLEDKNDGKVTLVADNGTVLGSIDKSKLTEDATNKGLFTFTRNDGTDVVFDVNTVNVEKIADANGNISYLFKDSKGATLTTIDSTADVVSNLTKKGDIYTEIINILEEETDSLTHLGNGKYKHISADETPVEFDVNTVNVSEAKDTAGNVIGYDFKDADGIVITTVKTAAGDNYYNDSTTNLGSTTVQGAIEKLLNKITTVEETKGSLTSTSIYVDGGANALLKDAKLDLRGGKVDGQVLVTTTKDVVVGQDANGADIVESRKVTEWKDPKQVVSNTLTAKNGINVVNDADGNSEFKLGGALTEAKTTITTTDTNVLAIEGLGTVEKGKVLENNLVIADKDGVLKQTSAKNLIEDAVEKGDLKAKNLTSESIVVTGGESSVLKDTQLEIKGGSSEGQVLVTTPKVDDQGKPVTDAAGNPVYTTKWVDAAGNTVKSGQGVTVGTDNTVNLGGKITNIGTTPGAVIDLTDDKGTKAGDIAIKGLEDLVGKDATTGTKLDTNTDNLVIADANGVLKQTSAKNLIEDAVGKGDLEAKTLKGDGITVTAGETVGTDTSVASSLLKNVTLGIAKGAVTSDKMKATVVNPNGGSTNAEAGMVPVANADGTVTYNKLDAKDVTYTKPAGEDNGLTSNTVEGVINELAGKKGDLKVAGTMLKVDDSAKGALRHDATISLDLAGVNKIVETNVDYTAKVEDVIILASATQGDLIVTLPEASTNKGKKYTIKKHDTNEDGYVIVEGNITGVAQGKKLETGLPYSGWDFVSDGTQWQIVNKF